MARASKTTSSSEEAPTKSAKMKAFDEALKMANAEVKSDLGAIIAKLSDRPMDVKTIPTGSVVLDSISGGGFPRGRLIEIYGKEASGKTSIALTAVGNVQREGGTAVFVDFENALDPNYARKLGVNIEELAVAQPDFAEQGLNLVYKLIQSGVVDIIVIDSIAAMIPKAELEADMEQQTIGLLARILSRGLKQIASAANKTGTTVVFINQTRDAVGSFSPYGTPQTTPGGKAMKFYASQRIEVQRKGQVKDGKDIIGNEVKIKIVKNKIAPPFGEGMTVLTFGRGINPAAELIEVGPEIGVITRPNNRTYIETETGEVIGKSKAEALEAIEKDEAMLARLQAAVKARMEADLFSDTLKKETSEEDLMKPDSADAGNITAADLLEEDDSEDEDLLEEDEEA